MVDEMAMPTKACWLANQAVDESKTQNGLIIKINKLLDCVRSLVLPRTIKKFKKVIIQDVCQRETREAGNK